MADRNMRLPHNIESEQQVIAGLLYRDEQFFEVSEILTAEDFFDKRHGAIFTTVEAIVASGQRVTVARIRDELATGTGGKAPPITAKYLDELADALVNPREVIGYAKQVADNAARRRYIEAIAQGMDRMLTIAADEDPDEVMDEVDAQIISARKVSNHKIMTVGEWANKSLNRLAAGVDDDKPTGLDYGLSAVNEAAGRAMPGHLIVLSGRPGEGKSALAGQAGKSFAGQGPGVAISLEMGGEEWAERLMSQVSRIPAWKIHNGIIRPDDLDVLMESSEGLRRLPFYVEQAGKLSVQKIRMRLIRYKALHDIKWAIIDHLHIIQKSDRRMSELEAVDENAQDLKQTAKFLGIPIVVLSQMNTDVRKRENSRPRSSDLMYSSSIEKNADVIMFCHRPEVAHSEKKPPEHERDRFGAWLEIAEKLKDQAEIVQTKRRGGKGNITRSMRFNGPLMKFEDIQDKQESLLSGEELEGF